ncbi:MAG: hypothetical protein ACXVBY_22075 [Isosphaeraceae bacterium]
MALTSLGAYLIGTRGLSLRKSKLAPALLETLECLGLTVIFLAGNLAAGSMLILGLRAFTGQFISVYWLNDISLLVFSVLQALAFYCWRRPTK